MEVRGRCLLEGWAEERDEAIEVSDVSKPEQLATRPDPVLVVGQGSRH